MMVPTDLGKRRFQHGAATASLLNERLPDDKALYRRAFDELWQTAISETAGAEARSA